MRTRTFTLEFLTPCFCAGADQTHAELRPSAIRGQLRWWFRAIGGSAQEESVVFGGVTEPNASASLIQIRAMSLPGDGENGWWKAIEPTGISPSAYLLGFFCGKKRLQPNGALAPKSRAKLHLQYGQLPNASVEEKLEKSIHLFLYMGAIGYRITRTAGAFATVEKPLSQASFSELTQFLSDKGFRTELDPKQFVSWPELVWHSGQMLKNRFRKGMGISAGRNGTSANPLGSATPRQASILHFRPIRLDGQLRLLLIEAPHQRILGIDAQRSPSYRNRPNILA